MNTQSTNLNLKNAVESRKSTQNLDAPSKFKKSFITNEVTTQFFNSLYTSIFHVSFSRSTTLFRLNLKIKPFKFNMLIPEPYFSRFFKPLIFIALLLPLLSLIWGVAQDTLGANPLEAVIRGLGDWGLRILLFTLLLSPLRRLLNWPQLLRLRRMLGLYAYFYVVLHLSTYLWLDQGLDWSEIWRDILERPFISIGMLAVVLLTPLAVTSTKGMIRRLGKNWKRLHALVYPISILAIIHFWWMVKLDVTEPVIYTVLLIILLGERLFRKLISLA